MKKMLAVLLCLAMTVGLMAGCAAEPEGNDKIALITMERADPYWLALEEGAMKAAGELEVEVVNLSPDVRDGEQQAGQISSAVSGGCDAIVIAAIESDPVSSALEEAAADGVKIIYVDTAADVAAEAVFATDNKAAGIAAGEAMLAGLEARGITQGTIGIVGETSDAAMQREAGFREAFEGKGYTLLETRYAEDDAAGSQSIAENYIDQGAAGIFGCSEAAATGSGNAVRDACAGTVVVGFGDSDAIRSLTEDGWIRTAIAQNPDVMGYEGIKAAAAALKGEDLGGAVTDTGVTLRKAENSAAAIPVSDTNDFKIALIAMDRVDPDWASLEAGAMKAAQELGCEVVDLSPVMSDDVLQAGQIDEAVASGCEAIVIAAVESDAVSAALKEAVAAGVRVVCVDSAADAAAEAVFSTDYQAAGVMAGETMLAELEAKGIREGTIGIIGVSESTASAFRQEAGFREALEDSGYTLPETQYGQGDAARSHAIARDYIAQGVTAIFCSSEGAAVGAGNAVKDAGADVTVVGFGDSEAVRSLVEEGALLAAMARNFEQMGYEAVKAACAALNGGKLGGIFIDTGVSVLTK